MKRFQTMHTPGRRTRLSTAIAGVLAGCAFAPLAHAVEFDTGNSDLTVRWDNQVRYAIGVRGEATGVPGGLTGATVLDNGLLLFVSQDGRLVASRNQGDSFEPVPVTRPGLFTDVTRAAAGRIIITGLGGVQSAALPRTLAP